MGVESFFQEAVCVGRICEYVFSKMKEIFSNVLTNSIKKFIKTFFDIIINLVKATIKKLLKLIKNLVLAVVDSVKIIADKNASVAQKADSVVNLFGVTITSCVVDAIFDFIQSNIPIPEFLILPLQTIATVVCTNFVTLILQQVDLFDVRFGFKMKALQDLFLETRKEYEENISAAEQAANEVIQQMINQAKQDATDIYEKLRAMNPYEQDAYGQLNQVNQMFHMNIDFDQEWLQFLGLNLSI